MLIISKSTEEVCCTDAVGSDVLIKDNLTMPWSELHIEKSKKKAAIEHAIAINKNKDCIRCIMSVVFESKL